MFEAISVGATGKDATSSKAPNPPAASGTGKLAKSPPNASEAPNANELAAAAAGASPLVGVKVDSFRLSESRRSASCSRRLLLLLLGVFPPLDLAADPSPDLLLRLLGGGVVVV